ncbi:transposable element Tcb2 transposase [Trichonephila clavipes]|nr:transposable element Tcb2 transposase [Trichonephila clavipes]
MLHNNCSEWHGRWRRLMETVSGYRIRREKALARSFKSYDYHRGSPFVHCRLFVRRLGVCVPLSSANKRVRLKWYRDQKNWSIDQWAIFLFIDESQFCLTSDSRRTFIRRTRDLNSHVREIDHYGSKYLMVWARIMLDMAAYTSMSLKEAL